MLYLLVPVDVGMNLKEKNSFVWYGGIKNIALNKEIGIFS